MPLSMSGTGENKREYADIAEPLFRRRRALCNGEPNRGWPRAQVVDAPRVYGKTLQSSLRRAYPEFVDSDSAPPNVITGDPSHKAWKVEQFASRMHPDYKDLCSSMRDAMARLSAEPGSDQEPNTPSPPALSPLAAKLLADQFSMPWEVLSEAAAAGVLDELRTFIRLPEVRSRPEWLPACGGMPPRFMVAKLARRLGIEEGCPKTNYDSKEELRQELKAIQQFWHARRRAYRRRANGDLRDKKEDAGDDAPLPRGGILKGEALAAVEAAAKPAALEEVWAWRDVWLDYWRAGVRLSSAGAVVEAQWSHFKRAMGLSAWLTEDTFNLCAGVAFLRISSGRRGTKKMFFVDSLRGLFYRN